MLFWCFFQFVSGCLCRTVGLGFIEGWCCFRAYIGLYSSGDQRTRRVKDQDEEVKGPGDQEDPGTRGPRDQRTTKGPKDQGNLKLIFQCFYMILYFSLGS